MGWALAAAVFVPAIPLVLIAAQLRSLLFDPSYYLEGQLRHAVGQTTEYTAEQLAPINAGIVSYFKSPTVALPVALADEGAGRDVFNRREVGHMDDVRSIVRTIGRLENLSLTVLLAIAAGRFASRGRPAVRWVAQRVLWGTGATLAFVGGMGAVTLVDFERLFLTFHVISFDNDLWQLDPRRDNLIRFFPFAFWFESTVTVALRTVFSAVVLALAAIVLLRWEGRRTAS